MRRQEGFTLTELLVVIAIIGVLAGLLLPAVQMAREMGRRATCTNNQSNIAKALLAKEATGKRFPGYMVANSKNVGDETGVHFYGSWVVQISEQLEQKPVITAWRNAAFATTCVGNVMIDTSMLPQIPLLICPSSPTVPEVGSCNYIVNCGVPDDYTNGLAQTLAYTNGLAQTLAPYRKSARDVGVFAAGSGSCSLSDIKDGSSQTLLTSENSYAGKWFGNQVAVKGPGVNAEDGYPTGMRVGASWEAALGFCWTATGTDIAIAPINYATTQLSMSEEERFDWSQLGLTPEKSYDLYTSGKLYPKGVLDGYENTVSFTYPGYATAASHHPDIVVGSLCDGSVRTFSQDIDPTVWVQLMTPNGHQYGEAVITGEY